MLIQGDGNLVYYYVKDASSDVGYVRYSVAKNLKKCENTINSDFVRVNQSYIINLNYMEWSKGNRTLKMKDPLNLDLKITATYRAYFIWATGGCSGPKVA